MFENELSDEQITDALLALAPFTINPRRIAPTGDTMRWYVSQRVEARRPGGATLVGVSGNGATPNAALRAHWHAVTTEADERGEYLVLDAMRPTRRAMRWNGFRWADVDEGQR